MAAFRPAVQRHRIPAERRRCSRSCAGSVRRRRLAYTRTSGRCADRRMDRAAWSVHTTSGAQRILYCAIEALLLPDLLPFRLDLLVSISVSHEALLSVLGTLLRHHSIFGQSDWYRPLEDRTKFKSCDDSVFTSDCSTGARTECIERERRETDSAMRCRAFLLAFHVFNWPASIAGVAGCRGLSKRDHAAYSGDRRLFPTCGYVVRDCIMPSSTHHGDSIAQNCTL